MFAVSPVATYVRTLVAVVATIGFAAASSSAQAPQPRRKCGDTKLPKSLPAADVLVDSATLLAVMSETLAGESDGVVVSLLYEIRESLPTLTLVAPRSLASDSAQRVLDVLRPNLKPVAPDARRWAVRLRLGGGANATLRVERAEFCPPVNLASVERASVMRSVVSPGGVMPSTSSRSRVRIDVDVHIDATGTVTNVQLRKGSGVPELDAEMLTLMRQRQYLPATVDGVAVPSVDRSIGGPVAM
jgi:TonB family protein